MAQEIPYAMVVETLEELEDGHSPEVSAPCSMFIGWLIDNDLLKDAFRAGCSSLLDQYRDGNKSRREILQLCFNDVITRSQLSDEGDRFSRRYLQPGWDFWYLKDLEKMFPDSSDFAYLEDSQENFERVSAAITGRFEFWKSKQ